MGASPQHGWLIGYMSKVPPLPFWKLTHTVWKLQLCIINPSSWTWMNVIPFEEQNTDLYLSRRTCLQTLVQRHENKTLNRFGRLWEAHSWCQRWIFEGPGSQIRVKDQDEGSRVWFKDQDPWHWTLAALVFVYWTSIWYLIGILWWGCVANIW